MDRVSGVVYNVVYEAMKIKRSVVDTVVFFGAFVVGALVLFFTGYEFLGYSTIITIWVIGMYFDNRWRKRENSPSPPKPMGYDPEYRSFFED